MKGRAERQLKGLEATEKKRKIRDQKMGLPHLHQPPVQNVERHSRMTVSSAEAVWKVGMRIVPVGNEVAVSCETAAKFDACALLHIRSALSSSQVSKCAHFCKLFQGTTVKSRYVSCQILCLTFVAKRWIKFDMYFKFIYYPTQAEPSRKL
jgi:hypothetical protein